MEVVGPHNLAVLLLLGAALLWTVQLVYGRPGAPRDDALRRILWIAGWLLVLLGVLGAVAGPLGMAGLVFWPAVVLIAAMALAKYHESEQRALIWMLAVAAEKGIPLSHAARAFADGRVDEMGLRTARLADLLDAGIPLPEALRQARHYLPLDALLAMRMAGGTGVLAAGLLQTGRQDQELEITLRSLWEKCFYLMLLIFAGLGIISFMMIKIMPIFAALFQDFELRLPAITVLVIGISDMFIHYWFLASPVYLAGLLLLLLGGMYYAGWLPRDLPVIDRFFRRSDSALLLRWLALAVRQQGSLVETIRALARQYPRAGIRGRLAQALNAMDQGADWCDSLQRVGLLGPAEAAVLKSAQQVGNLSWALEEMADSGLRRQTYRLRAALDLLFPAALLSFGFCVGLLALAVSLPLVELIVALT